MEKVKLGVVGLRRGWGVVYEILKEKTVQLSAICDHEEDRVKYVSEELDKMNYESLFKRNSDNFHVLREEIF